MKKNNKRALILSAVTLLLCVSMLIGSTFAWFTDNDTTTMNNIVAGTLDIEIQDAQGSNLDTLSFVLAGENQLWEPNCTFRTVDFQLVNVGNLNLKYKVELNNTEVSYNKLNEVLTYTLVNATTGEEVALDSLTDNVLAPNGTTGLHYIKVHMDENAGNEYQGESLSGVSITVYAAQATVEHDSYENTYDENAMYDDEVVTVATADEFIAAFANLEAGTNISLVADIDMTGKAWTPVNNISFSLNGNGHTVTGLGNGLVGHTASGEFTIKNVTFDKMTVTNSYENDTYSYAGLIGDADTCSYIMMKDVTISNSSINSNKGEDGYAGGFVAYTSGYNADNNGPVNASHNFINCSLVNTTVTGTSSAGGVVGHCGGNPATTTYIEGTKIVNSTVTGEKPAKDGNLIGTAHVGTIYIDNANVLADIGRFVPDTTGKLVIGGVEQTAFTNDQAYTAVSKNENISSDDVQTALNNGGIIDFSDSTIVTQPGESYALYYTRLPAGGVIKNLNIDGSAYGLRMDGGITFENCNFKGIQSPNISDGNGEPGKATFINCTFQSWIAFAESKVTSVEFINCTFANGGTYNFINSYQSTTFTDCTFESNFGMDDESVSEQTWTFINCTGLTDAMLNATGSQKTVVIVK